jgi:enoyl-CoA hydratase
LAVAADIRVVAKSAIFVVANVKLGLSGGEFGLSYLLPRLVGTGRAAELLYTGRQLSAVEAERWGIANRVVEPGEVMQTTLEIAAAISNNAPFAVQLTKEMLQVAVDSPSLAHTQVLENRTQLLAGYDGKTAEAIAAFRSKRVGG